MSGAGVAGRQPQSEDCGAGASPADSAAMRISVGCTLRYQVLAPSAAFTFNVLVNTDPQQQLVSEELICAPEVPTEIAATTKGERVLRAEAPTGPFELRYSAVVDVERPRMPAFVPADQPGRLPL